MNVTLFIALLVVFSTITSLCTEAAKKILNELNAKYATNILVVILSLIVGAAGTGVYYVLFSIEFNTINIVCMPLMGLATAVGSMVGYDKVIQTIEQLRNKF